MLIQTKLLTFYQCTTLKIISAVQSNMLSTTVMYCSNVVHIYYVIFNNFVNYNLLHITWCFSVSKYSIKFLSQA